LTNATNLPASTAPLRSQISPSMMALKASQRPFSDG